MCRGEVKVTCREVEHGIKVIESTEATGPTLHRREYALEAFYAGAGTHPKLTPFRLLLDGSISAGSYQLSF